MTYVPLLTIFVILITGAAITLTVLFRSIQAGQFSNLESGAYVIFDEDEPVGVPQDQVFWQDEDTDAPPSDHAPSDHAPSGHSPENGPPTDLSVNGSSSAS